MSPDIRIEDAERRLQDGHARTGAALKDLTQMRDRAQQRLNELGHELDTRGDA